MSAEPIWANVRFDYSGRHVLVVGGTSGIGGATARAYREAGATVTITGQRASAADYEGLDGFGYHRLDITGTDDMATVAGAKAMNVPWTTEVDANWEPPAQ